MLGDFNADCSYIRPNDWSQIALRSDESFLWLIDDHVDTTVSINTDCAYDRYSSHNRQNTLVDQNFIFLYLFRRANVGYSLIIYTL